MSSGLSWYMSASGDEESGIWSEADMTRYRTVQQGIKMRDDLLAQPECTHRAAANWSEERAAKSAVGGSRLVSNCERTWARGESRKNLVFQF